MACFLVTAAEAVVVTAVAHAVKASEQKKVDHVEVAGAVPLDSEENLTEIPWSRKLKWLSYLLWGGALLLCFEHIWHGEVVPWPPFLTAMQTPSEIVPMLKEIALYGTTMAVVITGVWFGMTLIAERLAGKLETEERAEQEV